MNIQIVTLDLFGHCLKGNTSPAPFAVRVWVKSEGMPKRYEVIVRPRAGVRGKFDLAELQTEDAFFDDFRFDHLSVYKILRVVGRALDGERFSLPYVVDQEQPPAARRAVNPK